MGISDIIAGFIQQELDNAGGALELQRSDLAQRFNCVPSQINYVMSTRFSPEHGYIVESRRGGGGYIRITRVQVDRQTLLMHVINSVGNTLDSRSARAIAQNLVDGEAVSRAVKDMLKKYNEFVPSPSLIIEYICRYYDVDEEQVRGQGRKRDLMEARQTAMYLIRRMTNLSLNDIGKEFGDRDHTTVLHSLDQVEKKMRSDPAYAEKVKEITTNINNKK